MKGWEAVEKTISWKGFVRNHIKPFFDKRNIARHEIDCTLLLEFANQLPHKGMGKVTVLSVLRPAFIQAKHYTQTKMTNILKRALEKANEVDINLYNIPKHSSISQAHRDGVSGADLALAADINIQTLQKCRDAAIMERKLSVFDRVVNLRDSALDLQS